MSLKNRLKKIPLLVYIVRKLRGQKVKMSELKQAEQIKKQEPAQAFTPEIDLGFMDSIKQLLDRVPVSSSGRFYTKAKHKLAMITDDFLYNSFKDVADSISLHPDSWREQIQGSDLLLIITGWKGLKEEWRGFSTESSAKRKIIAEIIEYCKTDGIPTVFYSIEDPPNYPYFIGIAQRCEYVFTAAIEKVPDYINDCRHNQVYPLMMGINPLFHNPVGSRGSEKLPGIIFSGSWMEKYPERKIDICVIFDGVLSSRRKLKVLDRNFALKDPDYTFPNKYTPYISPGIDHETLQKVHKLYDWAININTVKESATMFANRVYELEAAGNLLISNYSVGVNSHLPIVYTMQDSYEVAQILNTLTPLETQERQAAGIRHAMTGNTCFDRYAEICARIGLPTGLPKRTVAVVVKEITENLRNQFENQTYPDKELITEDELLQRYNNFDMIAFFSDTMEYDFFYLEDMINGFKYTDSDYITKDSYYIGHRRLDGVQHDFVQELPSKYCTVFWACSFEAEMLLDMPEGQVERANGYSIDCLHYNAEPYEKQKKMRKYKLSVILPVYNNGLHLYGKAFASLLRSGMFDDMEIILVDDGSTDGITEKYVRYIERRYDNVKTYFFGDGGSGSASRPRNKGVELAAADYITFLDPDNEAINDGYARLYDVAVNDGFDLVVGDMLRFSEVRKLADYYKYFTKYYRADIVEDDKKYFLKKILFNSMSIQAMVIEKKLLTESKIEQIIGAIGEDSLFSWQLFVNAERIKAMDFPIHIYYAAVSGSTVNTIGKKFFRKSYLLEPVQFKWLKENGLLEDYMNIKFNDFFRDWYLKKLSECKAEEKDEGAKIVLDIFNVYRDYYNGKDSEINSFIKN